MASAEGIGEYYRYCVAEPRGIAKVLWDFQSTHDGLSLQDLMQGLEPIKPREYSIANDCTAENG
jgi:sulfite reductase alpha subunit-like flavoprotein